MVCCAIEGCKSHSRCSIRFFNIPFRHPEVTKKWLLYAKPNVKAIYAKCFEGEEKEQITALKNINSRCVYRVCIKHFSEDDFEPVKPTFFNPKRLYPHAYPTLNLNTCENEVQVQQSPYVICEVKQSLSAENSGESSKTELNPVQAVSGNLFSFVGTETYLNLGAIQPPEINDNLTLAPLQGNLTQIPQSTEEKLANLKKNAITSIKSSMPVSSTVTFDDEPRPSLDANYAIKEETLDSSKEELLSIPNEIITQKKYIVFEKQLDELLSRAKCQVKGCAHMINERTITKSEKEGSFVTVKYYCLDGHVQTWESQPKIGKMPAGNLLIVACVLLTGCLFNQVLAFFDFMRIKGIGKSSYYALERKIVIPEIKSAWLKMQRLILSDVRNRKTCNISADGMYDLPGNSSKYCAMTLIDQKTDKCIHFELVQKSDVENKSINMDVEALKRCLNKMKKLKIKISQLTTDRHGQLKEYLQKFWPKIKHRFDVWHIVKSLRTKLTKITSTNKNHVTLKPWIKSICRHLWFCALNCKNNTEVLIEMWKSIGYHVTNRHYFPSFKKYKICSHGQWSKEDIKKKKFLVPSSATHEALNNLINEKRLLNDISQINTSCRTSSREKYHNIMNKYCSGQQTAFDFDAMEARMILTILEHNSKAEKKYPCEMSENYYYDDATAKWIAKPIKEPKKDDYLHELLKSIVNRQLEFKNVKPVLGSKRKVANSAAPIPFPIKTEAIKTEPIEHVKKRKLV